MSEGGWEGRREELCRTIFELAALLGFYLDAKIFSLYKSSGVKETR